MDLRSGNSGLAPAGESVTQLFKAAVEQGFSFLSQLGFIGPINNDAVIEYLSDRVLFNITWDPRSGELNAFLGMLSEGQCRDVYSVYDMFRMLELSAEYWTPPQISDPTRIGAAVHRLSNQLHAEALPALRGDKIFFRRLDVFRSAAAAKNMARMRVEAARSAAESAWLAGDFLHVVSAYEKMESELTKAEVMRLIYAKRKMDGAPDAS